MTQKGRRPTRERQVRQRPRVRMVRADLGLGHHAWHPEVEFGRSITKHPSWDQAMEWANWLAEPDQGWMR